jgi:hypothetical protein
MPSKPPSASSSSWAAARPARRLSVLADRDKGELRGAVGRAAVLDARAPAGVPPIRRRVRVCESEGGTEGVGQRRGA